MTFTIIAIILGIILFAVALTRIYLLMRRLIRYNSELKNGKTKRETELVKMKIDDLNWIK